MDPPSEAHQQQLGQFQQQVQQHMQLFQKQIHEHTQQQAQQQQQQHASQPGASQPSDHSQLQQSDNGNQQQHTHPESNLVQPVVEGPSNNGGSSIQNADSAPSGGQKNASIDGLNPAAAAAVAALAQLTQFAGTMSAAERAIFELGLQQVSEAGGYGQFPGFGRAQVPFQDHRSSFRGGGHRGRGRGQGRGRGRGRGRGFGRGGGPRHSNPQPNPSATQQSPGGADVASGPAEEKTGGSLEAPPQQPAMPENVAPVRIGWCDVCQLQCTSVEILEQQHKPGKRHQKNLQRMFSEAQGVKRSMTEYVGPEEKRAKTIDAPKVVVPLICDLCYVKCDTQLIFERHLAGKKHAAKVKKYEGHQATYGERGLQALYPPNPITHTLYNNPPTQTQPYVDHQAYYDAAAAAATTSSGYQQNPHPNSIPNLNAMHN